MRQPHSTSAIFRIRPHKDCHEESDARRRLVRSQRESFSPAKPSLICYSLSASTRRRATLAQLVEQLIRNQQVAGSNPAGGSRKSNRFNKVFNLDTLFVRLWNDLRTFAAQRRERFWRRCLPPQF